MLKTSDFYYDLPEELIAQTPIEPRDASRLLVYDRAKDTVEHRHFRDIGDYLKAGDLLVINTTKVYPARIYAYTSHGGKVEILLLKRLNLTDWECLVKPGKKCKEGVILVINEELKVEILSRTDDGGRIIRFIFDGVFAALGEIAAHKNQQFVAVGMFFDVFYMFGVSVVKGVVFGDYRGDFH